MGRFVSLCFVLLCCTHFDMLILSYSVQNVGVVVAAGMWFLSAKQQCLVVTSQEMFLFFCTQGK
jgi:hypothetical protein